MNRSMRLLMLAPIAVTLAGCSISKTVDPVKPVAVTQVCIHENPKVFMDGFQPEVERQLEAMSIQTRTYVGPRPPECSHYLEYIANWEWDITMYLAYAEFRVYDPHGMVGTAIYNTRFGGLNLDKFGRTAEKIRPLLTQLFASTTSVTAQESTVAAANTNAEARLRELQRLKDQALITEEEYNSKRQEVLKEI